MTSLFEGLYEFHGHRCPMSTIGARMGLAAMDALGVTKADQFNLDCRYFAKNCALDGIQYVTGCTLGNGNLACEDDGRYELSLVIRGGGGVSVSASKNAIGLLSLHRENKARILEERKSCTPGRAKEIDAELSRVFLNLVGWAQTVPDGELLTINKI